MILGYILIILSLLSLSGSTITKHYQQLKERSKFESIYLDPYVHRGSHVHTSGFNLKQLIQESPDAVEAFKTCIQKLYQSQLYNYPELSQDLIELFQTQVIFSGTPQSNQVLIHTIQDLAKLSPKPRLEKSYLILLQPKTDNSHSPPNLLSLFDSRLHFTDTVFNLATTPSPIVEALFGVTVAEDLKRCLEDQSSLSLSNEAFLRQFKTRHRLTQHRYHHLFDYQKIE